MGALVDVEAGGQRYIRPVRHSYGYLASTDASVHFGIGMAERVDGVTIRWPDGSEEAFPGMEPDQTVQLNKGQGGQR